MKNYDLIIDDIQLPALIKHKDKEHFICSVRQKPIQSKPEENLRQQIVAYLTDKLGYHSNYIDIEVPMTYFLPRKKGRADIIVYDRQFTRFDAKPFILIECKAPDNNKTLHDYRYHEQVNNYNELVNAEIVMLTNGNEFNIKETKTNKSLERLPTFLEVKNKKGFKFLETDKYYWERTSYKQKFEKKKQSFFIKENFISKSTDKKFLPYIIQLMDLFYDDKSIFKPQGLGEYELIKDCGLRPANYGYAFSSGLIGNYRFFLLKQKDGNHRIVSYSIYHQNDWGTYLMIAVDDRQGHSIELRFDKYIKTSKNNLYDIWHNGSMTVGKKGRLKNSEVIEYLKIYSPFLVKNNIVVLGTLDLSKDLDFDQTEVKDFVLRTSVYAILREQIRQEHQ
jgi:hypothetical protein